MQGATVRPSLCLSFTGPAGELPLSLSRALTLTLALTVTFTLTLSLSLSVVASNAVQVQPIF